MKKKYSASLKDKKDWTTFTKQMENISAKESDLLKEDIEVNKVPKLDLHGLSLVQANKIIRNFIIKSYNSGYKKLLVVIGKGSRSKAYNNPYLSEKLSVLKYSIPEYIKNDENLNHKISRISEASLKDGGEGAFYIFLKNNKNLKNEF